MRGAEIIRIINLRALSFCEAPEKLRKFANFANLGISCALLSVSIQCWFTSKSETSFMAPNFSLRSYSCIASPPSSSPSSSSVLVSEISKVSRPLPLPLLLGFCCCCCFCCEVQMQAHLMLPRTPPELQLCPHMPLSWRGLHPQCKHLGPPHRPLNWGRAGCNAGCNGCSCHIRPEADDELPSGTIGATSVRFRLVKIVMFAP